MTRTVTEWIGRTPDSKIPPRVRLRIFEREKSVCHLCKLSIQAGEKWEANHDPALINGGENRETMIFPAHIKCHAGHTRAAKAEKAKVAAVRKKHLGITAHKQKIRSRGFPKPAREARASSKPSLPPRQMFAPVERTKER